MEETGKDMAKDYKTRPINNVEHAEQNVPQQRSVVDKHRQCPICYQGHGGVGQANGSYAKASTLTQRYYKCNQCAHTWSVYVKPEEIISINDGVDS